MKERQIAGRGWRIARLLLLGLAIVITMVAVFYAEEDWRGQRAWENCKRELEARGYVMDWEKLIPPPVPAESNFFDVPGMSDLFLRSKIKNEFTARINNHPKFDAINRSIGDTNLITTTDAAKNYLAWSDQFETDFKRIRQALRRPYAQPEGDYTYPYPLPVPNFIMMRALAQTLGQRIRSHLMLGQPEQALGDATLLYDSRRILMQEPTGKPMTMVASMINVTVSGLYAETVANGIRSHAWREPELAVLQNQLKLINVAAPVVESYKEQLVFAPRSWEWEVATATNIDGLLDDKSWRKLYNPLWLTLRVAPRGWFYQNIKKMVPLQERALVGIDVVNQQFFPDKITKAENDNAAELRQNGPWAYMAAISLPNYYKADVNLARNQTSVNETQIACALERYRLAHGEYPETLDVLVPQFMDALPHDVIGGGPLHYRRTADGEFLLYSVGWDEKDDGGAVDPQGDREKGDWVW